MARRIESWWLEGPARADRVRARVTTPGFPAYQHHLPWLSTSGG
jgi:hypothetical protein